MISTRQLIFIINIAFFYFNPASSGNGDSPSDSHGEAVESHGVAVESHGVAGETYGEASESYGEAGAIYKAAGTSQCFRFLFYEGESTASNDDEATINAEVNSEQLQYCRMELFSAFQKEDPFENFLYAFKYLKKSDFEDKRSPYSFAAVEYYFDLLCTAYDINQPELLNPIEFCESRYKNEKEICLNSIVEIGCSAKFDGVLCVKKLYLYWRQEKMPSIVPVIGTENMSDEELKIAVSKGTSRFPDLSTEELLERLSDIGLSEDFYFENENRRTKVEHLFYFGTHSEYTEQRQKDIQDARYICYGISDKSFGDIFEEYNRRNTLYKLYGNSYATYLYNQLKTCEKSKFRDRTQFCKKFLSEYPDYYNFLYK